MSLLKPILQSEYVGRDVGNAVGLDVGVVVGINDGVVVGW